MEMFTIPRTVNDILEWKNDINRKNCSISIEKHNYDYTEKCGGYDMTDVLFSFLGIYAIGVWVFNKNIDGLFKIEKNKIKTLEEENSNCHKQILCSKKFLLRLQNEKVNKISIDDLNKCLEGFADKYFNVGNLVPMWPGGNNLKGNQNNGFMDIPELFYRKYSYWYEKLNEHPQAWLKEMNERVKNNRFDSLESFLLSIDSPEKYVEYINNAVMIIEDRTNKIINSVN
ncbi:MAG: hypothetical protein ACYDEX_15750 [Mobilitalea sp.]